MFVSLILEFFQVVSIFLLTLSCSKKKSVKSKEKILPISEGFGGDKKSEKKSREVPRKGSDENVGGTKSPTKENKVEAKSKSEVKKKVAAAEDSSSRKRKENLASAEPVKDLPQPKNPPSAVEETENGANQKSPPKSKKIPAEHCDKMEPTIESSDTPAVHDRTTNNEMILNPKVTTYMGNVDEDQNAAENERMEKEMEMACEKHEKRQKKQLKKSEESVESQDGTAGKRVNLKPENCVLFETKEVFTEENEEEDNPE